LGVDHVPESDLGPATGVIRIGAQSAGPALRGLRSTAGGPPLHVLRLDRHLARADPAAFRAHAHDVLVIAYVRRATGLLRIADRCFSPAAGDVFVISPGEVVELTADDGADVVDVDGWAVLFPPEVLGGRSAGRFLGWHGHPLLAPFTGGTGRTQRFALPEPARAGWEHLLATLDAEVRERREGHREAAAALLTLLLVDVARVVGSRPVAPDPVGDPLLPRVFELIEERYAEELSLRDVARQVGLTPEHLTTVVRRRTGRTVGAWITERRMTEARALLSRSELSVGQVASRVGYQDAAYFTRVFRRTHGETPRGWRRAATG
jgi:AraC family transcriptional activator of pobA